MRAFIKVLFLTIIICSFLFLNISPSIAATVLGTGNLALLGNDLTDPEGDGIYGTDGEAGNWIWWTNDRTKYI